MKLVTLIQGFYITDRMVEVARTFQGIGARQMLRNSSFTGKLYPTGSCGSMFDNEGESTLRELELTDTTIKFIKLYHDRIDPIEFSMTKNDEGDGWSGIFKGPEVGCGLVRCTISKVPEDYLLVPTTMPNFIANAA